MTGIDWLCDRCSSTRMDEVTQRLTDLNAAQLVSERVAAAEAEIERRLNQEWSTMVLTDMARRETMRP